MGHGLSHLQAKVKVADLLKFKDGSVPTKHTSKKSHVCILMYTSVNNTAILLSITELPI